MNALVYPGLFGEPLQTAPVVPVAYHHVRSVRGRPQDLRKGAYDGVDALARLARCKPPNREDESGLSRQWRLEIVQVRIRKAWLQTMRKQGNLAAFKALGLEKLFERITAWRSHPSGAAQGPAGQRREGFPNLDPVSRDPVPQPRISQTQQQPDWREVGMRHEGHADSRRHLQGSGHESQLLAPESYTRALTAPHDK